jgi:hypothetical protein
MLYGLSTLRQARIYRRPWGYKVVDRLRLGSLASISRRLAFGNTVLRFFSSRLKNLRFFKILESSLPGISLAILGTILFA